MAFLTEECTDREVLVEGPAGTGKSHGDLAYIHALAWKYHHSRHLICRATRVSMTESLLKTWEEQILGDRHPAYSGNAGRANRHAYEFPNKSTVVVGGLDNPEKLFSTEWDTVLVGEASEIGEDDWEKLGRAMRNNRMPYQQRIGETNPGPPAHWLNLRANPIENHLRNVVSREDWDRLQMYNEAPIGEARMRRLVSKHQDNPAYWDLENWCWTPVGQQYVVGELGSLSGHRRVRLLEGRWVAANGTVFPEFSIEKHCVDDFEPPPDWPQFVGIDPGFDHPCAVLFFALSPDGGIFVYDESYRNGWSIQQHCEEIKNRVRVQQRNILRMYADPQQWFNNTASGNCHKQALECGLKFHPWPRTQTAGSQGMVEAVRQLLINARSGRNYLRVCLRCVKTIEEFQSWSYKRTSSGDVPSGDDAYEDRDNHAMDVIKGIVAGGFLQREHQRMQNGIEAA